MPNSQKEVEMLGLDHIQTQFWPSLAFHTQRENNLGFY